MSVFGMKIGLGFFVVAVLFAWLGYKYGSRIATAVMPS